MLLGRLQLIDFRCYDEVDLRFSEGVTAIIGSNGEGKTNLLEAIGYLGGLSSFRGAPTDALVRNGASTAILRAELVHEGRDTLIEIEIVPGRRVRVEVNRQKLRRSRDLLGVVRTTVFAPDDLILVKGGPTERRHYLDEILVSLAVRNDALRSDLDKVLKQRNALLKQARGRLSAEIEATLDVWDAKFADLGDQLGTVRQELLDRLVPEIDQALADIAGGGDTIDAAYLTQWRDAGLAASLAAARPDDLRRGVSTVGPHRDDIVLTLNDMPARTHASQGEQRSIALALRLASHRIVTAETDQAPLLLLDDVLSELDEDRRSALLTALPECQTVLTTATDLPPEAHAGAVYVVRDHTVHTEAVDLTGGSHEDGSLEDGSHDPTEAGAPIATGSDTTDAFTVAS